jgi:GR25 family glycosyltransferase involved in LPS biosynthesis
MNKKIPIFIASMKGSPRLKYLTKKLQSLSLKYKIFYGIEGKNQKEKNIIYSQYNRKKVLNHVGREMGFNEIGGMYTIIRIYKYALKRNLENIIYFDDDFYPSYLFKEWIDNKIYFKGNKIIQFQCMPPGFLKKKSINVLNDKIKVHYAQTHLFNPGAAHVTIGFIKKFLKVTKGKTIGLGDYPFNFKKNNIELMQTVPFLGYPDNRGFSYLASDRKSFERTSFKKIRMFIYKKFSIGTINYILNLLRIPYYLFFIPFLLRKYKNLDYYMEYYFDKQFCKIKNFFFNSYIDIEKIYALKKYYPKDLKKYVKPRVFNV